MKNELTKQDLDNFLQGNYEEDITQDELRKLVGQYVGGVYYNIQDPWNHYACKALCFTENGAHFTLNNLPIINIDTGTRIIIGFRFSAFSGKILSLILGAGYYIDCHPINCFLYNSGNTTLSHRIFKGDDDKSETALYPHTSFLGCSNKCVVIDETADTVAIGEMRPLTNHHGRYVVQDGQLSHLSSHQFEEILKDCNLAKQTLVSVDDQANTIQSICLLPDTKSLGDIQQTESVFQRFWERVAHSMPSGETGPDVQNTSPFPGNGTPNPHVIFENRQDADADVISVPPAPGELHAIAPLLDAPIGRIPNLPPTTSGTSPEKREGTEAPSPSRADVVAMPGHSHGLPPESEAAEADTSEGDSLDVMVQSDGPTETSGNASQNITSEIEFLRQFIHAVEACGFEYDPQDLVRFHTSVKTGRFTLLGGAPGSGKSSLAKLYAMALLGGGEGMNIRDGFLTIDVNPAWVEPDDVLGYWNLNKDYIPASTGLVPFLWGSIGSKKVRLVCLEEMNLARVEHYFANFMQVFTREEDEQYLPGIPQQKDSRDQEERLKIDVSLRFVGTNNFDETTQNFSARFYDRCNYIELQRGKAKPFSKRLPKIDRVQFAFGVSWPTYKSWMVDNPSPDFLKDDIRNIYEKLIPSLDNLGITPSRRVENDILTYIANRPFFTGCGEGGEASEKGPQNVEQQKVALDEAIAQRVLPRYRYNYLRPCEAEYANQLETCLSEEHLKLSDAFFKKDMGKDERPGR